MLNAKEHDRYLESGKPLTLFVDIDGVLYVPRHHLAEGRAGLWTNPTCIANLQYLIDRYKAKVCWISSWRRSFTTEGLFTYFSGADLNVPLEQRLPNLPIPDERDDYDDKRGPIIERYCEEHGIKLDEILILDDDRPFTLMDRWVNMNGYDGLTYSRTLEAECILAGKPTKNRDMNGSLIGSY